jgi:hypothetical protein
MNRIVRDVQAESLFGLPVSMPLVLDLDGTLIAGDLLYKSFVSILRRNPFVVFQCAAWLLRGRAALKRQLALRSRIDWDRLQLHQDVLALAIREKTAGRAIVLATAADAVLAGQLASRLGFIDQVFSSDGRQNLKGSVKAELLPHAVSGRFHLRRRQHRRPEGLAVRTRYRSRRRPPIGRGRGACAGAADAGIVSSCRHLDAHPADCPDAVAN